MPIPRVFVSSTYYDLAPIRADVERMIRDLGYQPMLSELGSLTYDPRQHVATSAVHEVANCDMLVLIIGGRYGTAMPDDDVSVTNAEYDAAIDAGIPVFALVVDEVLHDLRTYANNVTNSEAHAERIRYGSVDSTAVFRFVNQVRDRAYNNALQPFRTFSEIEGYLKAQWGGLLQAHLREQAAEHQVADTLAELRGMSQKIEALSELILKAVNPGEADALEERLARVEQVRNIADWLISRGVQDLTKARESETLVSLMQASLSATETFAPSPSMERDYQQLRELSVPDLTLLQRWVGRRPTIRRSRSGPPARVGDLVTIAHGGTPADAVVTDIHDAENGDQLLVVRFADGTSQSVLPRSIIRVKRAPALRLSSLELTDPPIPEADPPNG